MLAVCCDARGRHDRGEKLRRRYAGRRAAGRGLEALIAVARLRPGDAVDRARVKADVAQRFLHRVNQRIVDAWRTARRPHARRAAPDAAAAA